MHILIKIIFLRNSKLSPDFPARVPHEFPPGLIVFKRDKKRHSAKCILYSKVWSHAGWEQHEWI